MTKKLTKHGNSLALIIDKPLLKMLNISEKTNLTLLIENGSLVIRPTGTKKKRTRSEIKKIAEQIMEEYAETFQKLAK